MEWPYRAIFNQYGRAENMVHYKESFPKRSPYFMFIKLKWIIKKPSIKNWEMNTNNTKINPEKLPKPLPYRSTNLLPRSAYFKTNRLYIPIYRNDTSFSSQGGQIGANIAWR